MKNGLCTLSVDIGGSGIKALVLDKDGRPVTERSRTETPCPAKPRRVLKVIERLARGQGDFDRVAIGFPGVVRHGVTWTAHNLHPSWVGFDLSEAVSGRTGRPTRVANDADIQGFGAICGQGVELVLTLGTGLGSALFVNGRLVPNLELAHHPFRKRATYEEYLGRDALDRVGWKLWSQRVVRASRRLHRLFNFDRLYLGGGNARKVKGNLPESVSRIPNVAGLLGGISLWRD